MFQSLQTQIIIVLGALVTVLFIQVFMAHQSQTMLIKNQQLNYASVAEVELAHELERDVVDLQRNVLIYKETASESSISRFHELLQSVNKKLISLTSYQANNVLNHTPPPSGNPSQDTESSPNTELIDSMQTHLADYKENFESVVDGRQQRTSIFQQKLQVGFDNIIIHLDSYSAKNSRLAKDVPIIKFHLAQAKSHSYQYLISPDYEHTVKFKKDINSAEILIKKHKSLSEEATTTSQLAKDFNRLTQVTRGYVFLVNVVMTGSANEFLFLTKELRTNVTERQRALNAHSETVASQTKFHRNIVAILSSALGVSIILFLIVRIISPIRSITQVFNTLATGGDIEKIPGTGRDDEIGLLARAADVFHKKNDQTNSLLLAAQEMNDTQEKLNQELSDEKHKAEQAVLSKSMFLANMSHEIRTPMNGIIGLVDLTLKTELTEKQQNYLKKISYSGEIMMGVINDILDFSKIEAGKLEIEHTEFDLNSMIENLIAAMYLRADEKSLNFRVNLTSNIPETLLGDPLRINQILLNLCNNAVKFTERGFVTVNISFEKTSDVNTTKANTGILKIAVTDSGIGMTPNQASKIFDSFTQADGSTSRKFGGTGLGLAIVKQLTGLMDGEIHVQSEEGQGSTFNVSISVGLLNDRTMFQSNDLGDNLLHYWHTKNSEILSKDYVNACELNASHAYLDSLTSPNPSSSSVFIDIPDKSFVERYSSIIDAFLKNGNRVGIITDMQPNNLKELIREKWNTPIISHPFPPSELKVFLHSVLDKEYNPATSKPIAQENVLGKYTGHILLVEDNVINQMVAGDMLEDMELTYDIAEDGKEAVEKVCSGTHYDLVLMDVQMPTMDGYQATQKLRELGYVDLIICGLSANAMKTDVELARQAGMNDYLTKPIEWDQLDAMCGKYIDTQPSSD